MRFLFTDELWPPFACRIEKAKKHRGGRKPQLSDRLFFEALLYLARTGIPWRDLPGDFGAWDAVYKQLLCVCGLIPARKAESPLPTYGLSKCVKQRANGRLERSKNSDD